MSRPAVRRVLAVVRNAVGGIRNYLKYTYGALDRSGYAFTVLSVTSAESVQLRRDLEPLGAKLIESESTADLVNRVRRELLTGNFDLVHSHGLRSAVYASPAVWCSRLLPWVRPVPHVVTSHDVFIPSEFAGARGFFMRMGLTMVLNCASAIISVSRGADENLSRYLPGLRRPLRSVVLNGIPPAPEDDAADAARWRSEVGGDGVALFGFFGRFMPQKGFEYVIQAADKLEKDPETRGRFRILAANDGSFIREMKAEVGRLGLTDRIAFTGATPAPRLWMGRVDAVLMPSLWEACGLVAMEALCAGTPLISTSVEGLADVTAGSPALIVPPRDGDALAAAMRAVMTEKQAIRSSALAFRDVACLRFDVREAARGLEAVFDRTLSAGEL